MKQIFLLGIPYDRNSSFLRGPERAPAEVRKALFSESSNLSTEIGIDLNFVLHDAGDLEISDQNFFDDLKSGVAKQLEKENRLILLGGDHSVTYPIVSAYASKFPKMDLLHFDAHPDIYANFEGNRYSHASPFARIMEDELVSRLVQVGVRTINQHQRDQIRKYNVEAIEMKNFQDALRLEFENPLYISFDIDAIDPAFAPGVSHPEPGGLSTRQALEVLQNLRAPLIAGADIVELNPERDLHDLTARVAAKLLREIAALMLQE